MLIRGVNKKGQGMSGLGLLATIVILAVIVVIVVLGVSGSLNPIFRALGIAASQDLEVVAQSCKFSAEQELVAGYCFNFKEVEINGNIEHLNCEDSRIVASLTDVDPLDCGTVELNGEQVSPAVDKCYDLVNERGYDGDEYVNGKKVEALGEGAVDPLAHCKIEFG